MPITESRILPSGSTVDLQVYDSSIGMHGSVAHWGERKDLKEVRENLARSGVPQEKLTGDTGFPTIYRQRPGLSRAEGIQDELTVATLIAESTIAANGWQKDDVDALYLGSGVPIVDDESIDDYAKEVARRVGLRDDIETHNTYAACSSGAHEFLLAVNNESLQGKKVLVMGMEGITTLTEDPKHADPFSIQVFSNGAAGIGAIPGEDLVVFNVEHKVVEDKRGALAAKMQYERLLDQSDSSIWQEREGLHMIRLPNPKDEMTLQMEPRTTAGLFLMNNDIFIADIYEKYKQDHPESEIAYMAVHHASKPMLEGTGKRLRDRGINIPMPWVVSDGNSSAATTLIAHNRLLDNASPKTRIMMVGYGAGASFDGGVIEYRQRKGLA